MLYLHKMNIFLLIFICTYLKYIKCTTSPCPNVFKYETNGNEKYGVITIPGPGEGKTVVSVSIAIKGDVYNSNSGALKLFKNLDATVRDAQKGRDVKYILNFPRSKNVPIITSINLNYNSICNGNRVSNAATWTFEHSFTYPSGVTHLSTVRNPSEQNPTVNSGLFFQIPAEPINRPFANNPFFTFGSVPNLNFTQSKPAPPVVKPQPVTPRPQPVTPKPQPVTPRPNPPSSRPIPPPIETGERTADNGAWLANYEFNSVCGTVEPFERNNELEATHLIIGGKPVFQGEYPWMVAMFHFIRRKTVYVCGATLISDRFVVTAAHCTVNQNRVQLEFGRHDVTLFKEPGDLVRLSERIIQHPDYLPLKAHADIALISFERIPSFSNTIKPVCIWRYGLNLDNFFQSGTITGWGQDEQGGERSATPMQLEVTRTSLETCRNSHPTLKEIASDKTFCAGGNSTGPCHGDSGSGFFLLHKRTWYLRGIISTSIGYETTCLLQHYAVYADIAFFLDWIKQNIT